MTTASQPSVLDKHRYFAASLTLYKKGARTARTHRVGEVEEHLARRRRYREEELDNVEEALACGDVKRRLILVLRGDNRKGGKGPLRGGLFARHAELVACLNQT